MKLVQAGYRVAQATTITPATTEAVASAAMSNPSFNTTEVRRNYQMSWPQYAREHDQRADLKRVGEWLDKKHVEMATGRLNVEWSERTSKLRKTLDTLYAQFREALREAPATK